MTLQRVNALPLVALALLLGAVPGITAAQEGEDNGFLSAPQVPASPYPREQVEPEVTIIETDTEVIYEYRVRGKVYMVKIDPIVGPPYYLMDIDGDGILDVQENRTPDLALPQWLLFSW